MKTSRKACDTVDPLRADFRNFLFVVWLHLNLSDPFPVQYDIAHFLQHGPKRMVIQAFRGVGKSWITSAFVAWLLYCNPQLNILVVSASKTRADEFSTFTLRLIMEMELLAHLRPGPDQRQSKISFDVGPAEADHAPSVKSVGITGQIAGSRADVIVADDIEVPNNSGTVTEREKLLHAVKEFDSVVKPGGRILFLGTPQTEESVYNKLPPIFVTRVWPARYPDATQAAKYDGRLSALILEHLEGNVGRSTAPTRFDDADLREREASIGRSVFQLQFMLDTSLSDADRYPLKLSDLIVFDCAPDKAPFDMAWSRDPRTLDQHLGQFTVGFSGDHYHRACFISEDRWNAYEGIVLAVDPSGRGGDETGYAVVGLLHSRLFLLDAGGLPGGYSDAVLQQLSVIARRYKVHKVVVEPNFGDGMFNKLLAPVLNAVWPCMIEDTERSVAQKEKRIIDCLEPVLNQHRLVVDRGLIERDFKSTESRGEHANRFRLFYQLTRITRDKGALMKDDRLDALSLAVHHWTSTMDHDVDKAAQATRDRLLEDELDRFFEDSPMPFLAHGRQDGMFTRRT